MPDYKCRIALKDGGIAERMIQSDSVGSLKKTIARDGGFLISSEKKSARLSLPSIFSRQRVKPKDFFSFNHEFLALLRAGIPVVLAFDGIIQKNEEYYFSEILQDIRDDISDGESVSNAFEKHGTVFSPLYIAALRSGEAGGNIPDAIEEYLEYFERSRAIRQKIKAASIYPAILTFCSVAVVAFLLIFVVPTLTGTFVESGADLPVFTKLLLQVSDLIRSYFWVMVLGAVIVFIGVSYYLKTEKGRLLFDTWVLHVPFFGELSVVYSTALFTSSLSTVLNSGLPLNRALHISTGLIQNAFMRACIHRAIQSIEHGEGFARALKVAKVFPDMAIRMMAAGEEGGSLEKVLKDIARFYEREIEARLSLIASTIEPLLMVIMGFVIGFIMLAMYMPIFQMAGTMG